MKILLVGEYSRLHNSLKEGLKKLGHEVHVKGLNDGFKSYPLDYLIYRKFNSGFLKKIKVLLFRLFQWDITSFLTCIQVKNNIDQFSNYDIVQLINENSFLCTPFYEKKILNLIFKNNKKIFLLACGDNYVSNNYYFNNDHICSIFTPYREGKITKKQFQASLKYLRKDYKKLHDFILEKCSGIISSDLDYHIPLINHPKYLGLIPNPINTSTNNYITNKQETKIKIFLGINLNSYYKKGFDYFEQALDIVSQKYTDKVEIIKTSNLPYYEYINSYNSATILLDQIYAKDQGYNALEAMAKGKVVFTGAGIEFNNHYQIKQKVAIDAKNDVDYLVNELIFLIENPDEITAIGKSARAFIENEHDYIKIAQKYIEKWTSKIN